MEDEQSGQYVNEKVFPSVSDEFRQAVIQAKRALYNAVIFANSEENASAQDNNIINNYLLYIQELHRILRHIFMRDASVHMDIEQFPEAARENIETLIDMSRTYMATNPENYDKLLYDDYIYMSLHEYPYVHNEDFLGD